ncbi:hypothetical protein U9M48_025477 [Paspalum notatum var. saurae]|uniref:Uncharacterized protein n=1 Tax=Paspalum notatum var. saurae TaxID=547442 RepID=A0AAQ3WXZ4_PASNO
MEAPSDPTPSPLRRRRRRGSTAFSLFPPRRRHSRLLPVNPAASARGRPSPSRSCRWRPCSWLCRLSTSSNLLVHGRLPGLPATPCASSTMDPVAELVLDASSPAVPAMAERKTRPPPHVLPHPVDGLLLRCAAASTNIQQPRRLLHRPWRPTVAWVGGSAARRERAR